jgi:hypothetical protein
MLIIALAALSLALTGCTLAPTAPPVPEQAPAFRGNVHGGQQPISSAHVYLFAAGTSGYGGNGIAPSSANASVSVLTAAETGQSDAVGPYVLTDNGGNFSIPAYTCTPGTQVYLYTLGGNPGAGTNSAAGLMAILGRCPASGNLDSAVPFAFVNEVTTVAAAYAFAGFATDATHVGSSGTALAQTGIANAFLNAANLVDLPTGTALATTPTANGGNGTVPQNEIYTLANILAYCVNSNDANGSISSNCSSLFALTLSSGTSGTTPSDTATAAINIAHCPGANATALYDLPLGAAPYTSAYGQPNDFTVGIVFTGGGLNSTAATSGVAIDASGNVWASNGGNYGSSGITKLTSVGTPVSPTGGYTAGGGFGAGSIAIDKSGNVWVSNFNDVAYYNNSGDPISTSPGYSYNYAYGNIAVDRLGNAWLSRTYNYEAIIEVNPGGNNATTIRNDTDNNPMGMAFDGAGNLWVANFSEVGKISSPGGTNSETVFAGYGGGGHSNQLAIDSAGNVWIANSNGSASSLSELSNNGTPITGNSGYTGGGIIDQPAAIAIDGAGCIWTANSARGVSEFTNGGAALSPASGYTGGYGASGTSGYLGTVDAPVGIAIDGSGNVWIANQGNGTLTEFIGAGTPVITPIAAGLPSTPTTDGSSNLGTRP